MINGTIVDHEYYLNSEVGCVQRTNIKPLINKVQDMFTGIVEEVGIIKSVGPDELAISALKITAGMVPGDSIAVNGTCLTATRVKGKIFTVDLMPETKRRTNLGNLILEDRVNLERAMTANGRFGGHFVQGHVDGTGKIISLVTEGNAVLMRVETPSNIMRYIVEKGFIAIDGVSLTVVNFDNRSFTVSLIGFTRKHTTLGMMKYNDIVNLEIDIMAKYAEKLLGKGKSDITLDFLESKGFLTT